MKSEMTTGTGDAVAARVIERTRNEAEACANAMRKGCGHALKAGLGLIWLHRETVSMGGDRSSVPRGTLGFEQAVEATGIPKRTAYRWMNACGAMVMSFGWGIEEVPEPDEPEWAEWEAELEKHAEGMSLNRLLMGAKEQSSEHHRLETLMTAAEDGQAKAIELLDEVTDGKKTLAQAVKALGGATATKGKTRRDPVYLDLDATSGELRGLVPTSLKTIRNAFLKWDELPEPARKKARDLWIDVVSILPRDLLER